ncbi:hypothetical protein ACFL6W_08665, partial [Thermodesulfobacteriota bacterium]
LQTVRFVIGRICKCSELCVIFNNCSPLASLKAQRTLRKSFLKQSGDVDCLKELIPQGYYKFA